jgi:hypothetical protein
MSQQQDQESSHAGEPAQGGTGQQQQQPQAESHAGQGSESAMRQLREWEQRRQSIAGSGGKRRNGPN